MFRPAFPFRRLGTAAALCAALSATGALAQARAHASDDELAPALAAEPVARLAKSLQVGDIVFTRIGFYPFRKVAEATGTWTNHVGIVLDVSGSEPVIGESRFPFSGSTTLSRFVARSAGGRVAVMRLPTPLTQAQQIAIVAAAAQREHVFYDTGFDAHSHRQFCSRYVREVLQQAAGVEVGQVETFEQLLASAPQADIGFWRVWYFGSIPWRRETVTPASVLHTPGLKTVYDGVAI
ncbi:YebB family permuted papain-like enzyme [Scleromatobacter humisilvae]|uniref:YebB family permuted papain-like enzyme n=1 Tax=Scleromatobacter humisilvae TaxID=2897159 RepID=A0A9X2C1Y6_9BURK|nr:YebB family permuted papain-like enzyme [Scleromatobacter humisilvae]MCK9689343.1 YebB family permuted papain-like enzyme [Scleromatobacter humisilvae]